MPVWVCVCANKRNVLRTTDDRRTDQQQQQFHMSIRGRCVSQSETDALRATRKKEAVVILVAQLGLPCPDGMDFSIRHWMKMHMAHTSFRWFEYSRMQWNISIDANGIVVRMWTCKHLSILYQNNHVPYKTEQWYVKWIRYYVHRFIYIFVFQVLKFGLFCFWCFYRSEVSACRGWSLNSFQFVWMSVWCAYMLFAYIYNTWHARQCQFDLLTRKYSALMPFIVDSATTT